MDDLAAELVAIEENLQRQDLTVLERAEHLQRRKEIYEKLHPAAARPKGEVSQAHAHGRLRRPAAAVSRYP